MLPDIPCGSLLKGFGFLDDTFHTVILPALTYPASGVLLQRREVLPDGAAFEPGPSSYCMRRYVGFPNGRIFPQGGRKAQMSTPKT